MFSSSPFPELPSSPNVFLPQSFFFDYEKDDVCFNYNQNNSDPFISYDCFFRSPSPVMENITTMKQDFVSQQEQFSEEPWLQYSCEEHDDLLDSVISSTKSKKKAGSSKKDGHSKIYTAQGPRDRRVRLSIDISRKFFCLQDLLGFDKASKTLDWLFSKSKTAIKELIEETSHCSSSSVTDQSKASFLEAIKRGLDDEDKGKKKKSDMSKCVDGKRKKMTQKSRGGFQENFTRDQSRAMARARARERTREKMHIKKLDDDLKAVVVPDDFDSQNMEYCNGGGNHKAILTANGILIDR